MLKGQKIKINDFKFHNSFNNFDLDTPPPP